MNAESYARFVWPGVLAAVLGIYAYWASQRELVTSRPSSPGQYDVPDPVPIPGHRAIHARLWEDPISATYQHWKELPDSQRAKRLHTVQDVDKKAPTEPRRLLSRPRRELAVVLSEQAKKHRSQWPDETTLCLPVLVPGEPYAEDKETRKRTRYAVVTALAESGYRLNYSRQLTYLVARIFVRVSKGWVQREIVVPVKRYGLENAAVNDPRPKRVLVLWIAESQLGIRPLLGLDHLLHEIFEMAFSTPEFKVAIIGPTSSDTLVAMECDVRQLRVSNCQAEWETHGTNYPWVAPESGFSLIQHPFNNQRCAPTPISIFSPRATIGNVRFVGAGSRLFKLYRVIGTDDQLADQLTEELLRRNAVGGSIVLVSERDTLYGRQFRDALKKSLDKLPPTDSLRRGDQLLRFNVLRGIDGNLPGKDTGQGADNTQTATSSSSLAATHTAVEQHPPEGRSQYDYLRRLPNQIRRHTTGRPPSAIGVVSTDVYDKLLVLRALRPQFPDCVFFTTDLEAIYMHPDETAHTRGLIVASHFGLTLGKKLQNHTPPFRDSYQTATFLATRLAIHDYCQQSTHRNNCSASKLMSDWRGQQTLSPLTHIVGRGHVRRLQKRGKSENDRSDLENGIHPEDPDARNGQLAFLFTLFLVAGFVALFWGSCRTVSGAHGGRNVGFRYWSVVFVVGLLVCAAIVPGSWLCVGWDAKAEDPSLFNGTTTWPRNLIYVIAGVCSVLLVGLLLLRFRAALDEASSSRTLAASVARRHFDGKHELNVLLVAIVVLTAAQLLVYGPPAPMITALGSSTATAVIAVGLAWRRQPPTTGRSLAPSTLHFASAIMWAAAAVALLMLVALLANRWRDWPAYGWSPVSMSRGEAMQTADQLAAIYALGAVGLLLSALLYVHYWCREYAREAQSTIAWPRDVDSELDRLRFVGMFTSAPTRVLPAVMGLLLILVLAYHPAISPVPMPTGVLVLASLGLAVFVTSALLLKRRFHLERQQAISSIDARVADLREAQIAEMRSDRTANPILEILRLRKEQIEGLSQGVFRQWQEPFGWILGGGTLLALSELWLRGLGVTP